MFIKKKENKNIIGKINLFYKLYFFLSLIILVSFLFIFLNTGIWKNSKDNLLNRIHINGLNNYLKIFSIGYQAIKYSTKNLDDVNLNISFEKFLALEKERKKIITDSEQMVRSQDHNFMTIRGNIENDIGEKVNVDLRLKGGRITHFEKNKTSYTLEVKKNKVFFNLRKFSLIKPRARNYIHEWIFHELIGEENLIKLKYDFINLKINGEDNGLYVIEERFDKILIERNNRRNGPIFSMMEEFSTDINSAEFEIYNKNFWKKSENREIVLIAQTKLQSFFKGSSEAKDIFDLDKWFWYFAVTDLTFTHHGLSPRNVKFFYNPLSGLFEPIGYDGHRMLPNYSNNLTNFNHQTTFERVSSCKTECSINDKTAHFLYKFFFNQKGEIIKDNYLLYKKKLAKISSENFLKNFFNEKKNKIDLYNAKIYSDYFLIDNTPYVKYGPGIYYFSYDDIYIRAQKLRSKIKYKNSKIKITEDEDKITFLNNNELNNYSTKVIEIFCHVFNKSNTYENQIKLSLDLNYNLKNPLIIYKENFIKNDISNCYRAKLKDKYLNETFFVEINSFGNQKDLLEKDLTDFKNFFYIEDKSLKLIKSETYISKDLYIPEGFKVEIKPLEKIFLVENSIIFSESPWQIGSKNSDRIYIGGLKNNFGGGIIIKTKNQKSSIINTDFKYLYGTKNRFLNLNESYFSIKSSYIGNNEFLIKKSKRINKKETINYTQGLNYMGAINFYESKIKIVNSSFSKIQAEDAINIISSDFEIYDTSFDTLASDAIDIDFGNGKFSNLIFDNVGNDALDFSGSNVDIKKISFRNIGDKSISVGENTKALIDDINGDNIFCGIAVKDGSYATVHNVILNNTKIPFASYSKKNFYDPPTLNIKDNPSVSNFEEMYLKDSNSKIIVKKKNITKINNNVFKIIYNKDLELL